MRSRTTAPQDVSWLPGWYALALGRPPDTARRVYPQYGHRSPSLPAGLPQPEHAPSTGRARGNRNGGCAEPRANRSSRCHALTARCRGARNSNPIGVIGCLHFGHANGRSAALPWVPRALNALRQVKQAKCCLWPQCSKSNDPIVALTPLGLTQNSFVPDSFVWVGNAETGTPHVKSISVLASDHKRRRRRDFPRARC